MAPAFLDATVVNELAKESQSGLYLNLAKIQGEARIRFFGGGITGWEAWTEDNKPLRWQTKPTEYPANIKRGDDNSVRIVRFIAGVVYDYDDDKFKIAILNKASVYKKFLEYCQTDEYGDATGWDLKIKKTGSGMDTEYNTLAMPPKPVARSIQERYTSEAASKWNLYALFDGDDPFTEA